MIPPWLSILSTILTPIMAVVIAYLLTERSKNRTDRKESAHQQIETLARQHEVDITAEGRFIDRLLERVQALEERELARQADINDRVMRIIFLEGENSTLKAKVDALRYELAGRITTVMSAVEQRAAAVLGDSLKSEEGSHGRPSKTRNTE